MPALNRRGWADGSYQGGQKGGQTPLESAVGGAGLDDRTHSFGYWLRRRRKALDLTQEALAGTVSCTRFTIRKIEADERRPSRRLAERLADKLAIPLPERDAFLEAARSVRGVEKLALDQRPVARLGPRLRGGDSAEQGSDRELAPRLRGGDSAREGGDARGPFVGRANEYGLLVGLLARLTAGSGHVVLLEGEPGIGKSRLMQEVAAYGAAQDLRTLATHCYEIERAMAYQPVIDLVTQALEHVSTEALGRLPPVAIAEIAGLVPAVAERVSVQSLSADFPQARQARLFQAIVQLFEAAAGGRQLVVMADDIQWADDASAQFIHYLARQAASRPLLLACAYRDEELDNQERLAGLVGSLRREGHARHIPLARFRVGDAEALLAGFADPRLDVPGLAARLHRETDGNPFFLTSMLHLLTQGEAPVDLSGELPLPDALRASVRARLSHVDAAARAVLDAAAVLGRRFDFETLLAVTRRPEDELLGALEALVRRRLLREATEDGSYDFSHDKVREVVYRDIVGARRKALHRAVAETIERRTEAGSHDRDAWLAEHYERAHVWKRALQHVLLAADRSQKLFAMRDALHWLDRAVALAESHPSALEAHSLVELYGRRGAARALAGQTEGAVADIRRVIDEARQRSDRARARDAFIQLGMAYRRADDYGRATQCLAEALLESRAMNDERRAADTLYHLGTVMWSNGRNREAITFHQEAVEICERLGLTDLIAVQAYHGRGEAHYNNLQPAEAIACYERSIDLARGIGDRSYECENLMMIAFACTGYMGLADYARAESSYRAALAIARGADLQWHLGPTLLGLEHIHACTGRYGEAYDGMMKALRWLESVKQTRYQLMACDLLGHLLLDLGFYRQAVERCERGLALATREGITFWRPRMEANLAIARLRLGDLGVGPALEGALDECRRHSEATQGARCLEGLAQWALARGDAVACRAYADELLSWVEPAGMRELAGVGRRWRGEAMLAQRNHRAALEDLDRALAAAQSIGRPRLAADIHEALARLHEARGSRAQARRHGEDADDIAAGIVRSLAGSGLEGIIPAPVASSH
jgi:tetratricopeptide (TPR) repeat protein/transcriptional regulator with XRE-family HTH domain